MVDNIDAEVEQVFAVLFLGGDEGTDIQFEFVESIVARFSSDISKLRVPLGLACIVYMALMF